MKRVLIAITLVISIFTLAGCKSESAMYEPDPSFDQDTEPDEPANPVVDPVINGGESTATANLSALIDRKIYYEADLKLETPDPNAAYNEIVDMLDDYSAYIEEANITSTVYVIKVRVLSENFGAFVEDAKLNGDIVSFEQSSTDVTNTYSNLEARKSALEAYQTRLIELIADASFNESITLMKEQADVETELLSISQDLSEYDSLIDFSTVEITIRKSITQEIILPRTTTPTISIIEVGKNQIDIEINNYSDQAVTLNVDIYQNGEFIQEYVETAFPDSKEIISIGGLDSNTEYKIRVVSLAEEHRISTEATRLFTTEATFINRISNVFISSFEVLVIILEGVVLVIVALFPFLVVGGILGTGFYFLNKRFFHIKFKGRGYQYRQHQQRELLKQPNPKQ